MERKDATKFASRAGFTSGCGGLLFAATLAAAGCGGGGGGSSAGSAAVTVAFPPANSETDVDAATVRGTSVVAGVTQLQVNGVDAATSNDFADWSVDVPVASGTTPLDVSFVDGRGRHGAGRVNVVSRRWPAQPAHMQLDGARFRLLFVSPDGEGLTGLFALSLVDGRMSVVSDASHGTGPVFSTASGLEFDPARNEAYVLDRTGDVLAVDVVTGNRRILSPDDFNFTLNFGDLALAAGGDRLFAVDLIDRKVIAIERANGVRTLISDDTRGSGAAFAFPTGVATDDAGDRLLVADAFGGDNGALVSVEVATGNRTVISDDSHGTGPSLNDASDVRVEAGGGFALVPCTIFGIVRVELFSGDRTLVTGGQGSGVGRGFEVRSMTDVVELDPAGHLLAVSSPQDHTVVQVDAATGDRAELYLERTGAGERIAFARDVAFDPTRNSLIVLDLQRTAVWSVDLRRGDRTVLPADVASAFGGSAVDPATGTLFIATFGRLDALDRGATQLRAVSGVGIRGSGPDLAQVDDLAISDDAKRAFVTCQDVDGIFILGVDVVTGDRTLLSGKLRDGTRRGAGLDFDFDEIVADPARNRLLVADRRHNLIVAVDVASGDRSVMSDASTSVGAGPRFVSVVGLALANDRSRLFVADFAGSLFAVDLANGDRTVVSGPRLGDSALGSGPRLFAAESIAAGADGRVYAAVGLHGAIIAIDPASGGRAIVSR